MRRAAQPEPERSSYVVPVSQASATWTHATEPVRPLVALGFALVLTAVAIDHLLSGRLTFFFDLCFVSICLLLALRAGADALYTAAVLPPALMFLTCVLLAYTAPAMVAHADDSVAQALVSGLAHHAPALAVGYGLCLATLLSRRRRDQPSNRDGSPAPTRRTSG